MSALDEGNVGTEILVVDDDVELGKSISRVLKRLGCRTTVFHRCADVLEERETIQNSDLALIDVHLPDGSGLDLLRKLMAENADLPIVMMSGNSEIKTAIDAVRSGAQDFLEKPISPDKVRGVVAGFDLANRSTSPSVNGVAPKPPARPVNATSMLVGESSAVQKLRQQIALIGPSNARVLIAGENGTGKELIAREIVRHSRRSEQPFEKVNCAAIPSELIDSELFGHEKGAFTGANQKRRGLFELADGGTLFLDEVGEMDLNMQAKLLRVLQELAFKRVGGEQLQYVDVRIIAATNRDLSTQVNEGKFREDLYFRLNVIPVWVPPLRERRGDIPVLAKHFFQKIALADAGSPPVLEDAAIRKLMSYSYPGNIRELQNLVERLYVLSAGDRVTVARVEQAVELDPLRGKSPGLFRPGVAFKDLMNEAQKSIISEALEYSGWNVTAAASMLGLERSHLSKKCRSLGLKRPGSLDDDSNDVAYG